MKACTLLLSRTCSSVPVRIDTRQLKSSSSKWEALGSKTQKAYSYRSRVPRHEIPRAKRSWRPILTRCSATETEAQSPSENEKLNKLKIYEIDLNLEPFRDHLDYRYDQYLATKNFIEENEGSVEDFALGHKYFGFQKEDDGSIIFREWAPAAIEAELVGEFNSWNGENHKLESNAFGVWQIKLDPGSILHETRVKLRLKRADGSWAYVIPAWIKRAVQPEDQIVLDGVYWDPPVKYVFEYPRPPKPKTPRVYELHVGIAGPEPRVHTYTEVADNVLPRIKRLGYNCIQLMAIQEHSYYASFGYHVTNFFAVSSRQGTPDELKYLIDSAHGMGICVFLDIIHSHASTNTDDGLNGFDFGQKTEDSYFHNGPKGYHSQWDSRCFNYKGYEVLRFLLSNARYWMDEYMFDGFRFDGVTSMLYTHHGIDIGFSGGYHEYFGLQSDVEAIVYLMIANEMIHNVYHDAITIAEDVSGMPTMCRPVSEGGVGFDYRLAMAVPDKWIDILKNKRDEHWSMGEIVTTLCNRRRGSFGEKNIAYCESHDQALVGDKTIAFWLMDKEMYEFMSLLGPDTPVIIRGVALHKMIRFITAALGGEGYLAFVGNEFGHPEWLDFPREGNGWSHHHCKRQFDLADDHDLRYNQLEKFDAAIMNLDKQYDYISNEHLLVSSQDEEEKVIVFERGELVFVFNFHPTESYDDYKIGCRDPGKYRLAIDSDAYDFGGQGRVPHDWDYFSQPEGEPGQPETNFNNRCCSITLKTVPSRTCQVENQFVPI